MIGLQQVAFGRQSSFQMVEKLPQIRPRLRFAGGRPQQESQVFPRLRRIAMKYQICDQRMERLVFTAVTALPAKLIRRLPNKLIRICNDK